MVVRISQLRSLHSGATRRATQATSNTLERHEHSVHAIRSLILEVLNAHPSLRDSKHYLNSFAPRPRPPAPQGSTPPPLPLRGQAGPSRSRAPVGIRLPPSFSPPPVPVPGSSASIAAPNGQADSHAFSALDHAAPPTSTDKELQADVAVEIATKLQSEAALVADLEPPPPQSHTALVKVQGPFTQRQLESIAEGMVYLKKLGLVSIIVVDSEESSWRDGALRFSPDDGSPLSNLGDEDAELAPWTGGKSRNPTSVGSIAKGQEMLRRRMTQDVFKLSELLARKGAEARPFPHALVRVDAHAAQGKESEVQGGARKVISQAQQRASTSQPFAWAQSAKKPAQHLGHSHEAGARSPLVSDDGLASLRSALESDQIPVLAPLAIYSDVEMEGAERTVCVRADDVLVGLARDMAAEGTKIEQSAPGGLPVFDVIDLTPVRLMVINREGGIPSHARGGNPHLAINLASEYSHITNSFIWSRSHPTALSNLSMIQDCLNYMPQTSSGVVVSHRSPRSLIGNLITNKAAHSPSLPHRLLAGRQDVRHTPTIIRPGLDVRVIYDFSQVDRDKLTTLLEKSFGRSLKVEEYYARLERSCDFVIVTGDYEGAAIVTREYAPGEVEGVHEPIAYLDKFAVLPTLQGSGTVDFLWGALRDEVHGLGLLDALNDNGGKGGFGRGRDLVWKSRANNPVNRWYYERSNGFMRIDTSPTSGVDGQHSPDWAMFWCDAEERLARMAGERRLGAEASAEDVLDMMDEDASASASRRSNFADEDDFDLEDNGRSRGDGGSRSPSRRPLLAHDPSTGRPLSELDPRPGGAGEKLLPVIAPEETGRLQRWASCMRTIPTAWA